METREIRIISTKTQNQYVLRSAATTLGELKAELDREGIEYAGMTFLEGHAKVELKDNSSILPTNIPFRGAVTNDLVFMLTVPDKKINLG